MVKSVTVVMSNKILSRGTELAQTQWYEKELIIIRKRMRNNNHNTSK